MTVLSALAAYYDRLAERGEVARLGYAPAKISFEIVINGSGGLVEVAPLGDRSGRKPEPQTIVVPSPPADRRGKKIVPAFLWDNTAYALGVAREEIVEANIRRVRPSGRDRADQKHAVFVASQRAKLQGADDEGLCAFLAFLESWRPERFSAEDLPPDMLGQNVVFRLQGDRTDGGQRRFLHDRPAARTIWAANAADTIGEGLCLVTGERGLVQRIHLPIKGAGGQPTGVQVISFNEDAFESYGRKKGALAPVSAEAAFAFGTALNKLLEKGFGRSEKVRSSKPLGRDEPRSASDRKAGTRDMAVVFWADARETGDAAAEAAEEVWTVAFDPDREDAPRLAAAVKQVAEGQPTAKLAPDLDPRTRMYVLGISPNKARLAVRFWHVGSFGELAKNLCQHWENLKIDPDPFRGRPPTAKQLLYEIAAHHPEGHGGDTVWRRSEKSQPPARLGGELLAAIIVGRRYPLTLLDNVVIRVRAERGRVTGARAALVKAVINRNARLDGGEELPVARDPKNKDPAYLLGALFALYEHAEAAGNDRNATLRDKYFAAASATPRRVFSILNNSYTHDLAKLRKGKRPGLGVNIEKEVTAIMGHLSPDFPKAMPLEAQGRFVVGYYHQAQERYRKRDGAGEDSSGSDGGADENASGEN